MEYGKFNSAEELLKGYTELEKSFTQKCQQLSELQKQVATEQNEEKKQNLIGTSGQPSPNDATPSTADDAANSVPTSSDADSCSNESQSVALPPKVMMGGGNVSMALPNRPKTLKEASELAKKYLK